MTLKISKGHMWRAPIEDKPGSFAQSLEPFAKVGHNLQIVTGWSDKKANGSVEIFPIGDEKSKKCALQAGLQEVTDMVCLIIEGEDRPGLAYDMAKAIAEAGINLRYAVCQGVKQSFLACFGFQNDTDAQRAQQVLSKF